MNEILKENFKNILFFHRFQKSLINENKLFSIMPIKSNTLEDKKLRIIKFHETIEIYNLWVKHSNYFSSISQEEITAKISQEKNNYKIN